LATKQNNLAVVLQINASIYYGTENLNLPLVYQRPVFMLL